MKKPHLGTCGRVAQQERIRHDVVDVEELDRCQRAPDFLPAACEVRAMQDIHQRPLQTCYSHGYTRALGVEHARVLSPGAAQGCGKPRSPENL